MKPILILALIAFLIIPLMLSIPMREGFVTKAKEPSIFSSIYGFFIGDTTFHIIGYVIAGIALFAGIGFMMVGSQSQPIQAGGRR
jgi:hypothetical protein